MENLIEIKTTKRNPNHVVVDISDEACLPFGFKHGEIAVNPHAGHEVLIVGVGPGNDGTDVLWYIIQHPRIDGEACYYGGAKNLIEAGFKRKT